MEIHGEKFHYATAV
ncbi:hypothetical protein E2C01_070156 [Portunus trituberculatus]|uniref:Uncharacterized protein n=1 Tax=Portunus trituberculatus TaxID=210409 RepID=A0A5B7HWI6_PORTR|nr:hypothetical protein [Portunus trituberculatus]